MPGWLDRLLSWQWPAPPDVGGAAANAPGRSAKDCKEHGTPSRAATELGTSYQPGGWSWVGGAGRELVLSARGAEVAPNREAKVGRGRRDSGIGTAQMVVQNKTDMYSVGPRLRDMMRRR